MIMEVEARGRAWFTAAGLAFAVLLAGCTGPEVVCGGNISPRNPSAVELKLLEVAKKESAGFCNVQNAGCDFAVYETRAGRTVRVSLERPSSNGKCASYFGGDKFYAFDESGNLESVINGL
jgi:hypothetical protein